MTWQERLQQCGLTEETAPNMIKKVIRELRAFEKNKAAAEAELQKPNITERKKQQAEEAIEVYKDAIEAQPDIIIKKIDQWDRNKEKYAELGQKLKTSKQGKTAAKAPAAAAVVQAAPSSDPTHGNAKNGVQTQTAEPTEKKSGATAVALFLILGVLSFGAYNYLKNDR